MSDCSGMMNSRCERMSKELSWRDDGRLIRGLDSGMMQIGCGCSMFIGWMGQILGQSFLVCAYGYVIDPGGTFVLSMSVNIGWIDQILG